MVFKERLKEKRTEANLTQVELAEKAGVTARTIQNYELGSRKPSNMVTIQKIADALNTTTEYLLGSSGTYVVEAHEKGGACTIISLTSAYDRASLFPRTAVPDQCRLLPTSHRTVHHHLYIQR